MQHTQRITQLFRFCMYYILYPFSFSICSLSMSPFIIAVCNIVSSESKILSYLNVKYFSIYNTC